MAYKTTGRLLPWVIFSVLQGGCADIHASSITDETFHANLESGLLSIIIEYKRAATQFNRQTGGRFDILSRKKGGKLKPITLTYEDIPAFIESAIGLVALDDEASTYAEILRVDLYNLFQKFDAPYAYVQPDGKSHILGPALDTIVKSPALVAFLRTQHNPKIDPDMASRIVTSLFERLRFLNSLSDAFSSDRQNVHLFQNRVKNIAHMLGIPIDLPPNSPERVEHIITLANEKLAHQIALAQTLGMALPRKNYFSKLIDPDDKHVTHLVISHQNTKISINGIFWFEGLASALRKDPAQRHQDLLSFVKPDNQN